MPVKARSREDDLDLTPDQEATQSASKSKAPKGKLSKKRRTGTSALGKPVRSQRSGPSITGVDLAENQNATGPFTDYVIGGPTGSKNDTGGTTKRATLPSAPLISATPGLSPDTGQGRYYLLFVSSSDQSLVKTRVPVDFERSPKVTIGRDPGNAVVIPDRVVSRLHAELTMQDGRVYLKDHQSTNGTFLYDGTDFQPVQDSVEVTPNSVIRFGTGMIVKLTRE